MREGFYEPKKAAATRSRKKYCRREPSPRGFLPKCRGLETSEQLAERLRERLAKRQTTVARATYFWASLRAHEVVRLPTDDPLYVVGVDDSGCDWAAREIHLESLERLASEIPRDGPSVLLVHRPEVFPQAARLGFPLVLGRRCSRDRSCRRGRRRCSSCRRAPRGRRCARLRRRECELAHRLRRPREARGRLGR